MKVLVFDLGGTLMQYTGMPYSWIDYYRQGFEAIMNTFNYNISPENINKSIQMLSDFNPRINYREIEYPPEFIFTKIFEQWHLNLSTQKCIKTFWKGLNLKAELYPDAVGVLKKLKEKGYIIATLTDLPSAMPDEFFKDDISELLSHFDFYMSSAISGYRKPNCKGLQMISEKFAIPMNKLIFIGDEEKDKKTALNANCKFIQIQRTARAAGSIKNLYDLLDILD